MTADPPARRRPWLRLVLAGFLGLLVAAALALETEAGFRRIVVPLADQFLEGQLDVARGRMSWAGVVEVTGVRYRESDLELTVERLALHTAPLSWVWGDRPRLRLLDARGLRVIAEVADASEGEPEAAPGPAAEPPRVASIPATIERLRVDDAVVELRRAGETGTLLGPLALRAIDLAPGRAGSLELSLPYQHRPAAPVDASDPDEGLVAGVLALDARVDQREPGIARIGLALDASLAERDGNGAPRPGVEPFHATLELAGTLTEQAGLELEPSTLTLERAATKLVEVGIRGSSDLSAYSRLHLELRSPDLGAALSSLAVVLPPAIHEALAGAPLGGALDVALSRKGGRLEGELSVVGLPLHAANGEPFVGALHARPRLRTDAELTVIEIEGFELEVPERGTASVSGPIRLGGPGGALSAELQVKSDGLHLAPWLTLVTGTLVRRPGAFPTTADVALSLLPDGSVSAVGRGRFQLPARGGEGIEVVLRHDISRAPDGRLLATLDASGPGVGGEGSVHLEGVLAPGREAVEMSGEIASLDVTPLLEALASESVDPSPTAPEVPAGSAEDSAGGLAGLPAAIDLDVRIGALRLRDVTVRDGRLTLRRRGEDWDLGLARTRVGPGHVEGSFARTSGSEGQKLDWRAQVRNLDLGALVRSLQPDRPGLLVGRLQLDSRGGGRVAAGADPIEAVNGRVAVRVEEGRARGVQLLTFIAEKAGIDAFGDISFDGVAGDFPVKAGSVQLRGVEIDGDVAHLVIDGDVGVRGLDLVVNPRVGPGLAPNSRGPFAAALLSTTTGLLALPLVVTVKGPWAEPALFARPATPAGIGRLFGGVVEAATAVVTGEGPSEGGPGGEPPTGNDGAGAGPAPDAPIEPVEEPMSPESSALAAPRPGGRSSDSVPPAPNVESTDSVSPAPNVESTDSVSPAPKVESTDSVSPAPKVESTDPVPPVRTVESTDSVPRAPTVGPTGSTAPVAPAGPGRRSRSRPRLVDPEEATGRPRLGRPR